MTEKHQGWRWAAASAVVVLMGCGSPATPGTQRTEAIYTAPETALGSNLPRRGEKRTGEAKELSGEALDEMRRTVTPGPVRGSGN